jgi:hypothetical protein
VADFNVSARDLARFAESLAAPQSSARACAAPGALKPGVTHSDGTEAPHLRPGRDGARHCVADAGGVPHPEVPQGLRGWVVGSCGEQVFGSLWFENVFLCTTGRLRDAER